MKKSTQITSLFIVFSVALLMGVGGCAIDNPIDYTTGEVISSPDSLGDDGNSSSISNMVGWTQQLGTSTSDIGSSVRTDESNNIIVLGRTDGNLNGDLNSGSNDMFLAKYDPNGQQLWTSLFGGTGSDSGNIVEVASSGNIYVAGSTNGSLPNSSNVRHSDVFLVKFNSSGEKQWHQQIGSSAWEGASGLAIDSNENVYLSGSTGSIYGDALGTFAGVSHLGKNDTFIIKYDSEGNRIWTKLIGTNNNELSSSDMEIDDQNNLYISGITDGNLNGNTGSAGTDVFVMKLDPDGNEIWTRLVYSNSSRSVVTDFGSRNANSSTNLTIGSSGKIYIIAHTKTDFDNHLNIGGADLGLVIVNNDGNIKCSTIFGTSQDDYSKVITVDKSDNFYIGYNSSANINSVNNIGGTDGFLIKYDNNCSPVETEIFGSDQDDSISSITFDSSGNLIILGHTLGAFNDNVNLGSYDTFIKKVIK